MAAEITRADEKTLARLVTGTHAHALRRLHEMEASTELLRSLDVDPIMTRSTAENLRRILNDWPDPRDEQKAGPRKLPDWWRQAFDKKC